jgi:hypothetical protein
MEIAPEKNRQCEPCPRGKVKHHGIASARATLSADSSVSLDWPDPPQYLVTSA